MVYLQVDHCSPDIIVAHKLLDSEQVSPHSKQMRSKGVSQRVEAYFFLYPGFKQSLVESPHQAFFAVRQTFILTIEEIFLRFIFTIIFTV